MHGSTIANVRLFRRIAIRVDRIHKKNGVQVLSPNSRKPTHRHTTEAGSVLIISMVALVALAGLGGFTALSVQSGVSAQSASRFQSVALYSAESGVAAAMQYLRTQIHPINNWNALVEKNNVNPQQPVAIPGNGQKPGDPGYPFVSGAKPYAGWYEVTVLNNESDPGFGRNKTGPGLLDTDARLVLRVVGHGPNGATTTIEVDITANNADELTGIPCSYNAQQGLSAQNSGVGCISSDIDTTGGIKSVTP